MSNLLARVLHACHLAACIPLLILVMLTTGDIVARYAIATSIPDTIEISSLMLGLLISLALPATAREQVSFDLLLNALGPKARLGMQIVTGLLSMIVFVLMGWEAIKRVARSRAIGEFVGSMEIMVWPAKSIFALGCVLTALALCAMVLSLARRLLARQS